MCFSIAALGMTSTQTAMTAATLAATAYSAYSQNQSNNYNAKVAEQNQEIADRSAKDAVQRGADEAARVKEQSRIVAARQRAGAASGGVSVDTGSALDLLTETAGMGELDAQLTLNNAQRQAYGYKTQAMNQEAQARLSRSQAVSQPLGTLMTGASTAYGQYQNSELLKRK